MLRKNILSISVALIILYLSLASAETFNKIPVFHFRDMDKVVHFGMYATLMGAILFENRKRIETNGRLALIACIPFIFGAMLELMQSWLTTSRSGSIYDQLANSFGILFSVSVFLLFRNRKTEGVK
jgi:VanZ family protein